jgi:hypothetical protein
MLFTTSKRGEHLRAIYVHSASRHPVRLDFVALIKRPEKRKKNGKNGKNRKKRKKPEKAICAPGTDVMITIFCNFLTIFGKKIGVFLKNQCYHQIFS